jgi:hypothetical protein
MSTRAAVTEEGSSVSIAVTGGFNCAFILAESLLRGNDGFA